MNTPIPSTESRTSREMVDRYEAAIDVADSNQHRYIWFATVHLQKMMHENKSPRATSIVKYADELLAYFMRMTIGPYLKNLYRSMNSCNPDRFSRRFVYLRVILLIWWLKTQIAHLENFLLILKLTNENTKLLPEPPYKAAWDKALARDRLREQQHLSIERIARRRIKARSAKIGAASPSSTKVMRTSGHRT